MKSHFLPALAAALLSAGTAQLAAQEFKGVAGGISERDYLGDLPVVLSVSRLAQPLDETPGAVTVLDRDIIRRSGARDLTDLMRLVPGFVVGHTTGANPIANYHGDFDSLSRRLQVFVDGRSIYSPLFAGNVSHPMMGLVLDDIERIEVLRGSNSAGYGANAFSGVINVVTRNAADVPPATVLLNLGEKGIADGSARLAWGDSNMAFRLTASRSGDHGFDNEVDDKLVEQIHLRGDLHPSLRDDLMLAAGSVLHQWEENPPRRDETWRNVFVQARWVRRLDEGAELRLNASVDEEKLENQSYYLKLQGVAHQYRTDGRARRSSLEAEHVSQLRPDLRLVWGGQWRREEVVSPALFSVPDAQTAELRRLFANLEWRPHPEWVVNAGGLWEDHSIVGPHTAPRLAVNYHVLPDHTLRVGTTQAYRMPTLFELRGDWRTPALPGSFVLASGGIRPERLVAKEIGYLGEFRQLGLSVDLRAFVESGSSVARYFGAYPNDVINKDPYRKRGWETQLRWRPRPETQVLLNYTALKVRSATSASDELIAPTHATSLVWFETLPAGFEWSLACHSSGAMSWVGVKDMLEPRPRVDLRLAKRFKTGATHVELALVTHSAAGSYEDGDSSIRFPRRSFLTLRMDF